MIALSLKRLNKKGFTFSRESGPPKLKNINATFLFMGFESDPSIAQHA